VRGIPVSFEYEGKQYQGFLNAVSGSGVTGTHWHLMIGSRYWGQLVFTTGFGFRFASNKEDMEHLSDYFGDVVIAWHQ
jgi:hypothetical protein